MPIREPIFTDAQRNLKELDSGEAVRPVNIFLQLRGYLHASADYSPAANEHLFTPMTTLALKTYQRDRGLSQSGIVDDATFDSFKSHRCGRPNAPTRELNHSLLIETLPDPGNPWKTNKITYRLTRPSNRADLTVEKTEEALEAAFKIWSDALDILEFEKLTTGVAMIEIRFYGREPHDHDEEDSESAFQVVTPDNNAILAHAFYPLHELLGKKAGDIHVNDLVNWADPTAKYNLVSVLAHEIGHSLGFSHSDSSSSIMTAEYDQKHTTLPDIDKTNLENVYVRNYQLEITSILDGKSGGKNPVGITAKAPAAPDAGAPAVPDQPPVPAAGPPPP